MEWRSESRREIRIDVVDFSGILAIDGAEAATAAYWSGIGSAKGFGCGLLKLQEL
jgi:CRISPR-associated protein Cas6/Cse3/CasE subtype I-E